MKKAILIVLLLMIQFGAAMNTSDANTSDVNVLKMYDTNGDGVIDAHERLALDIDIENRRLRFDDAALGDMLAENGTILLSDDFQQLVKRAGENMTPDVRNDEVTITVINKTVPEPTPEATETPVTHVPETNGSTPGFAGCFAILGVLTVAYMYYRRQR